MSNTNTSTPPGGGIGFAGLLAIAFITLKLIGAIDWSWWWVLAPLWGSLVLWVLLVFIIIGAGVFVAGFRALWNFFTKP